MSCTSKNKMHSSATTTMVDLCKDESDTELSSQRLPPSSQPSAATTYRPSSPLFVAPVKPDRGEAVTDIDVWENIPRLEGASTMRASATVEDGLAALKPGDSIPAATLRELRAASFLRSEQKTQRPSTCPQSQPSNAARSDHTHHEIIDLT